MSGKKTEIGRMSRLHSCRLARRSLLCVRVIDAFTVIYQRQKGIVGQCDCDVQHEDRAIRETYA